MELDRAMSDYSDSELQEIRARTWQEMSRLVSGKTMNAQQVRQYDTAEKLLDLSDGELQKREFRSPLQVTGNGWLAEDEDRSEVATTPEYRDAFETYVRFGKEATSSEQMKLLQDRYVSPGTETRAMGTITGAGGGFLVPEGFSGEIARATKAFGGLRRAPVRTITTQSGNDIPWPTVDDTANEGSGVHDENVQATEQDVTVGEVVLEAHNWNSGIVKVHRNLLQDSAIPLEQLIPSLLGERIGRSQAGFLATGTGTDQPEGILTNIVAGHTAGAADSFVREDFLEMEAALDPSYWDAASWVVSPNALKVIRELEDADGRPLLIEDTVAANSVRSLLGYPLFVDANFPAVAATNTPVMFGDLSAYVVRDVAQQGLIRAEERYMESNQVGFLLFTRMDAKPVDAGNDPYLALQMAAA